MGFRNPIVAGTTLVRTAIQSPNYSHGASGWSINQAGDVEFTSGVFRGTVQGGSFVGSNWVSDSLGTRMYSGVPALGNLIESMAPAAAQDSFGNAFPAGHACFLPGGNPSAPVQIVNELNGVLYSGYAPSASTQLDYAKAASWSAESPGTALLRGINEAGKGTVELAFTDGNTSGGPSAASPTLQIQATQGNAYVPVLGAVVGGDSVNGPALWQSPAYTTGWADSSAFNGQSGQSKLRFRKGNHDQVIVEGCAAAVTGAGAVVFVLPAGYTPLGSASIPPNGNVMLPAMQYDPTSGKPIMGMARVDGSGNVTLSTADGFAAVVSGTQVWINGAFQLGNIP